jgi:hypothetical protein
MNGAREIRCTGCGKDALVRREAVFDGFRKTGERFVCVSCGHAYEGETEVPWKTARVRPKVFGEDDAPKRSSLFADEEPQNCRHCKHYLVNPFTQRCGLHRREVQATDCCAQFVGKA